MTAYIAIAVWGIVCYLIGLYKGEKRGFLAHSVVTYTLLERGVIKWADDAEAKLVASCSHRLPPEVIEATRNLTKAYGPKS